MKNKKRFIAIFIAMSVLLSSFATISTYAMDIDNNPEPITSDEESMGIYNEIDIINNEVENVIKENSNVVSLPKDEDTQLVNAEDELQPMVAEYCEDNGGTSSSGGIFAGYRYGYYPNAARPYYLGHPDGRSLGIGDPTLFDLCDDYRSTIQAMIHAEDNAEALTRLLGYAVTVAMVLGGNLESIKEITEVVFVSMAIELLDYEFDLTSSIRDEIIDILLPAFVDIQYLMNEADNIFDNLYALCSN